MSCRVVSVSSLIEVYLYSRSPVKELRRGGVQCSAVQCSAIPHAAHPNGYSNATMNNMNGKGDARLHNNNNNDDDDDDDDVRGPKGQQQRRRQRGSAFVCPFTFTIFVVLAIGTIVLFKLVTETGLIRRTLYKHELMQQQQQQQQQAPHYNSSKYDDNNSPTTTTRTATQQFYAISNTSDDDDADDDANADADAISKTTTTSSREIKTIVSGSTFQTELKYSTSEQGKSQ